MSAASSKSAIWEVFHKYDDVRGIHRKLKHYIQDNGLWKIDYFIAHLSHEIYDAHNKKGHIVRVEKIRPNLKKLAKEMYKQVLQGR